MTPSPPPEVEEGVYVTIRWVPSPSTCREDQLLAVTGGMLACEGDRGMLACEGSGDEGTLRSTKM